MLTLILSSAVPFSFAQLGAPSPSLALTGAPSSAKGTTVIAFSHSRQFVGAVAGPTVLFVGLLNGTVLRMDPIDGKVTGSVVLPDRNSAAHLTYFNGSLFVGTEWLSGARDTPPYHVYKIDPNTMLVVSQLSMGSHYANGFLMAINGHLWAGDGLCTLYEINPGTLRVEGTVSHVAEDEFLFDGTYYWAECKHEVHVLKPTIAAPVEVASGSLVYPNRPRGFFVLGASLYASGSLDFALYSMSVTQSSVSFRFSGSLGNHSHPTRDTLQFQDRIYTYQTCADADHGKMTARLHIYGTDLRLKSVLKLPGAALPADASQHSLFTFGGRVYFVTANAIGYIRDIMVSPFAVGGINLGQGGIGGHTLTTLGLQQNLSVRPRLVHSIPP